MPEMARGRWEDWYQIVATREGYLVVLGSHELDVM